LSLISTHSGLANLYVLLGDASPHGLTPLDPPLHVAVVSSVALVVGRLIMVCQHGGKMRTGSSSLIRSLTLRRSAGLQSAFNPRPVMATSAHPGSLAPLLLIKHGVIDRAHAWSE